MRVPSWDQGSVRWNEVECVTLQSVCLSDLKWTASTDWLCSTPCHCRTHLWPTTLLWNGIRRWDSPFPMLPTPWKIISHVKLLIVARFRGTSPSDRVSLCGLKHKTFKAVLYKHFHLLSTSVFHILSTSVFAAIELKNVKITPHSIKVLVGDTLYLNCSGETSYNGRINFTWGFPRMAVSNVSMLHFFLWAALFKAYDTALPFFRTITTMYLKKKAPLLWFFLWATP